MGVFDGSGVRGSGLLRRGASTLLGAYGRTVLVVAERIGPRETASAEVRSVTRRQFDVEMRRRFPWLDEGDAARLFDHAMLASYRNRRDTPGRSGRTCRTGRTGPT